MSSTRAFRRCHVCGETCESQKKIQRCDHCGKPFAPFYYFDDQFTPIQNDGGLRPQALEGQYKPLQGLTAYWNEG